MPPTAAPIEAVDCWYGLAGFFSEERAVRRFEHELMEAFGAKKVFLVSSGKAALTIVLRALGALTPEKSEVIIPAYTCYSVPSAIVWAGLTVVPVDVVAETLDFNLGALKQAIGPSTLCIIPDHLFGRPAALNELTSLCRERKTFLVEDAAQAMGGEYEGKRLGTVGDVGIFSLGRGKNITCGGGGVIVTDSDEIATELRRQVAALPEPSPLVELLALLAMMLMAVCINPSLYWLPAGLPFLGLGETKFHRDFPIMRLSGMRAGLLRRWKQNLARGNAARRENARNYISMMPRISGEDGSIPFLRLPYLLDSPEERDEILALSNRYGLGISAMYPTSVDEIPELQPHLRKGDCPQAREVARRLITLPTHHLVTAADREKIVNLLCR